MVKIMGKFVIENGVLKAYFGKDTVVVVPDGVTHIGGDLSDADKSNPNLRGDLLGYKAFFHNSHITELYLPDSTVEIGFKSLEHCKSLEVLTALTKITICFPVFPLCAMHSYVFMLSSCFNFKNFYVFLSIPDI